MPSLDAVCRNGQEVAALTLTADETILCWHRGLALSDNALGCAMLDKTRHHGLGRTLPFR